MKENKGGKYGFLRIFAIIIIIFVGIFSCIHTINKINSIINYTHNTTVWKEYNHIGVISDQSDFENLKYGFGNISGLPRLYQGIVKRDCLERVKEEFGNYFPGPSPDMANAIALSFVVKRLFYYDTPVIITGQCRSVGGGEKLMNGNLKYIGEIPFLPKDIETTWDKRLPPLWCSDTIWPQSAIEVLNKKHIKWKINYERIYARFVFHHPQYNKCINNKFINRCVFEGNLFYFRIADYFRYTKVRLQSLFSNNSLVNDNMVKRDIEDIQEAESFIYQNWCC